LHILQSKASCDDNFFLPSSKAPPIANQVDSEYDLLRFRYNVIERKRPVIKSTNMPKKPFSGKQKKEQLRAKRERIANRVSRADQPEGVIHLDKETNDAEDGDGADVDGATASGFSKVEEVDVDVPEARVVSKRVCRFALSGRERFK